uniref:Uncharacterized protein n=1 Tax=Plectus sambesii TaxID=2011161 RepID=A0A914V602_9BILA
MPSTVIFLELASFENASVSDGGDNRTVMTAAVGRRRYSPMATILLALVLAVCACSPVDALRCYCTTSKGAAECENNVCEFAVDSSEESDARPACAALNHSISGIHYACVRSKTEADETTCKVGPTGNGGTVTACWCRDVDFCNRNLFDRTLMDTDSSSDDFSTHFSSVERSGHASVEQRVHSSAERPDHSSTERSGHSSVDHHAHSPVEQHEDTSVERHGPSSVEHHGHSSVEQHGLPVDATDIEITAAKMDDIDNI